MRLGLPLAALRSRLHAVARSAEPVGVLRRQISLTQVTAIVNVAGVAVIESTAR